MTRIEKVVREVSDLREFYLRITQEKKRLGGGNAANLSGNQPATPAGDQIYKDGEGGIKHIV